MIGIQAMSVIANQTGHTDDAAKYSRIAHDYITQWQDLAIAKDANPPRTTLSYGDAASHGTCTLFMVSEVLLTGFAGLLYNLFADAQLGLGLVPESVYQMQSNFYPTVANKYGVPLDTRHTYTKGKSYRDFSSSMLTCQQVTGSASQQQSVPSILGLCSSRIWLPGSTTLQQTAP